MSGQSTTTHIKPQTRSKSHSPSGRTLQPSWSRNAIRQLKLILPGAAITYFLGTVDKFLAILQTGDGSWKSKIALAAFGNGVAMITLFLYVLAFIHLRGENLDWRTWRQSGPLSAIIPILTTTIIAGWLLHFVTLGKWSDLGYTKGFMGASALYTLIFGLLALIPAPRKSKGD